MKFKKFLIIILSVALLSCFAVSTFATDATIAATIPDYGFYISPGDYVFSDELTFVDYSFRFFFTFRNSDIVYSSLNFFKVENYDDADLIFEQFVDDDLVYRVAVATFRYRENIMHFGWNSEDYRYISVLEGFYIYDINVYQWWQSNVTRVDPGYDNNLLDGILSSFTFIGEWIAGAANAVTPMFWDGEALTVVGTLSVAGLSFAVVFLLIALVSSFMKFRS